MGKRIEVGINENIFLKNAVLDDKDNLILTFKNDSVVLSGFEALAADDIQEDTGTLEVRIFSPMPPKAEGRTIEKQQDLAIADVTRTRSVLQHLMMGYITKNDANLGPVMYLNTTINKDNFGTEILKKDVLLAIHRNMCREFLNRMKPYIGDEKLKFRLKLVRQSKDKHYATLPSKYLDDNPFWESMDIPVGATKVKFTEYEVKEGLNNGTPASKTDTADKPATEPVPMSAENVFQQ